MTEDITPRIRKLVITIRILWGLMAVLGAGWFAIVIVWLIRNTNTPQVDAWLPWLIGILLILETLLFCGIEGTEDEINYVVDEIKRLMEKTK